jgi:hypothetical protein
LDGKGRVLNGFKIPLAEEFFNLVLKIPTNRPKLLIKLSLVHEIQSKNTDLRLIGHH